MNSTPICFGNYKPSKKCNNCGFKSKCKYERKKRRRKR